MPTAVRLVLAALSIFAVVVCTGGLVVWTVGHGEYGLGQSVYFALITVTTVGFGELPKMEHSDGLRAVTAALIILGVGSFAFLQSTLTALLVEGFIGRTFRRRRMDRRIQRINEHVIVVGCGRTGHYILQELDAAGRAFVVIDRNEDALVETASQLELDFPYVVGDATEDRTLIQAGVERAEGMVVALIEDRDNLLVTLSARSLNRSIRIVAKVAQVENEQKMIRAGASNTVSPHQMGGIRMVGELVHPNVVGFFDRVRLAENLRFEEVELEQGSSLVGAPLRDTSIRSETKLLVVALREPDGKYIYNPSAEYILEAGTYLIVMGDPGGVRRLKELVASDGGVSELGSTGR